MKRVSSLFLVITWATSVVLAQPARNTTQGIHYIKLANTLRAVDKSQESIKLLQRALPAFTPRSLYWQAVTNELMGLSYNDIQERAKALSYLERARAQYAKLNYVASAWGVNEIIREISGKNLYAGVQIGRSGVKLVILKTEYETDFYEKEVQSIVEIPGGVLSDATLSANASTSFQAAPNALRACLDSIRRYNIPDGRIFVVLSSEVKDEVAQTPEGKKRLYQQLAQALPNGLRIDTTLTAGREAELFTVGAIPRKVWPSTSALFLGNTNTMGGYFDGDTRPARTSKTFHPISSPVGVNTLVDRIESKRSLGMEAYRREAQRVVKTVADSAVRAIFDAQRQGLNERRTVGVGGDIAWALVTYLHPERAGTPAVPITPDDLERFKRLALNDYRELTRPNLAGIPDAAIRSKAEQDLKLIQSQLSEKQLIAGALWLDALLKAYSDSPIPKRFVFIRSADIGWVTGKFLETINYEYESTIAKGALYTR